MEDWYYWICCALHDARFYFDVRPDAWALVRVHSTSISKNRVQMYIYEELIRSKMLSRIKSISLKNTNNSKIVELSEAIALDYMLKKKLLKGAKYFVKAAKYSGSYVYYTKSFLFWAKKSLNF